MRMTCEQAEDFVRSAGFDVLGSKALADGYGYAPEDPRYFEQPPRECWWFVKTGYGWIEIGWRKRVISIDWSDLGVTCSVTEDKVTKGPTYVHAWSAANAAAYLNALYIHCRNLGRTYLRYSTIS